MTITEARKFAKNIDEFKHLPKAGGVMKAAFQALMSSTIRVRHAQSRSDMMLANQVLKAMKENKHG